MGERRSIVDFLGPVGADDFASSYVSKQLLHVSGPDEAYDDILGEIALFERLSDASFYAKHQVLMRQDTAREHDRQRKCYNPAEMLGFFKSGYSVFVPNYQDLLSPRSPLVDVARSITRLSGYPLRGMTCFCSPPQAQAMPAHVDPFDVYTLQLRGSKRWIIETGRPPAGAPSVEGCPEAHTVTIDLRQGDLLYIPANMRHSVVSLDDVSLSIAIVIRPLTEKDVTRTALDAFLRSRDPGFLTPRHDGVDRKEALVSIKETLSDLSSFIAKVDPRTIADELHRRVLRDQRATAVIDLCEVGLGSSDDKVVVRRSEVLWQKTESKGQTRYFFSGGRSLTVRAECADALDRILLSDRPLRLSEADVPDQDQPGSSLVRTLVEAGLVALEPASERAVP